MMSFLWYTQSGIVIEKPATTHHPPHHHTPSRVLCGSWIVNTRQVPLSLDWPTYTETSPVVPRSTDRHKCSPAPLTSPQTPTAESFCLSTDKPFRKFIKSRHSRMNEANFDTRNAKYPNIRDFFSGLTTHEKNNSDFVLFSISVLAIC